MAADSPIEKVVKKLSEQMDVLPSVLSLPKHLMNMGPIVRLQ
jgi:hypothetical protein